MICKLKHTGKKTTEETPENECECLGYQEITVVSLLAFKYEKMASGGLSTGLIMDCLVKRQDGSVSSDRNHWLDIESDIRNGYLVPV